MNAPYQIRIDYKEAEAIRLFLCEYINSQTTPSTSGFSAEYVTELLKELLFIFANPDWVPWSMKRQRKSGKPSERLIRLRRSESMLFVRISEWDGFEGDYENALVRSIASDLWKQKIDIVDRDDLSVLSQNFVLEEWVEKNQIKLSHQQI